MRADCGLHAVARPVLELRGFRRLTLAAGECRTVSFTLAAEQLAFTGGDLRRIVEPGRITVSIGTSSADRPLSAEIVLTGPVAELARRTRFRTPVTVR